HGEHLRPWPALSEQTGLGRGPRTEVDHETGTLGADPCGEIEEGAGALIGVAEVLRGIPGVRHQLPSSLLRSSYLLGWTGAGGRSGAQLREVLERAQLLRRLQQRGAEGEQGGMPGGARPRGGVQRAVRVSGK